MVRNPFLPEKINENYLFDKIIVGFDIGKTHVNSTDVLLSGTTTTILNSTELEIESFEAQSYEEKIALAIKHSLEKSNKNAQIYSSISSSIMIFKELELPFIDNSQIQKVIGSEIEGSLPFPIDDAYFDFLITKQDKKAKITNIIVAAVQKKYILEHINLFSQAGIEPAKITVDLFDLYGILKKTSSSNYTGPRALIDMGLSSTRIAYIENNTLRFIRTIPTGISLIATLVGKDLGLGKNEAMERIIRFGLEQNSNKEFESIKKHSEELLNKLKFTLDTFESKLNLVGKTQEILLLGGGAEIKNITNFISNYLKITCNHFNLKQLQDATWIKFKKDISLNQRGLLSAATAISDRTYNEFNLNKIEEQKILKTTLKNQLITLFIVMIMVYGLIIFNGFWKSSKLNAEIKKSTQEALTQLKSNNITISKNNLKGALEEATKELETENTKWFAYSQQNDLLKYWEKLCANIDKESIGLNITKLAISKERIILEGSVKDLSVIKNFQKELNDTKLFKTPISLEQESFSLDMPLKNPNNKEYL
ncbi:MAG: Type IV pilus assembly protein PilM [candidate division TM6 bacterium GW2011_GWF2_32_72]|nr:MAG: Type IV pilus assembly protein PilM [candidate division TM6 bacterium GW2011_GWF2_32_72]